MEGPGPTQYGPRFNGGPGFNRPPFDRSYDGPPYDRPFDHPHFDGPGRPPFDGPPFDGPSYESGRFDDNYYDRSGSRGPRAPRSVEPLPPRRSRSDRDGESRSERPPRSSRWAESEPLEKSDTKPDVKASQPEDTPKNEVSNIEVSEENLIDKSPISNVTSDCTVENVDNKSDNPDIPVVQNANTNDNDGFDNSVLPETDRVEEVNEVTEVKPQEENSDEGRGTPCRDEPTAAAANSAPDLVDP